MEVAVVGSGIAALVSAWSLGESGAKVTIFEKNAQIGFDGYCVPAEQTPSQFIDVPLRLHNPVQWPRLFEMFQQIGVETTEVDSSQTFCDSDGNRYFGLAHGDIFSTATGLLSGRGRRILLDIQRFRKEGGSMLENGIDPQMTFGKFLNRGGYSDDFQYGFLYPVLSSTVCTCSYQALSRYPATILVEALSKITVKARDAGSYLLRARYGAKDIVSKLLASQPTVKTLASVESVLESEGRAKVSYLDLSRNLKIHEDFDYVVVGVQANHACKILGDDARRLLEQFEYEDVEVLVHTDLSLMPSRRRDWATFNMLSAKNVSGCSIWLQRFYANSDLPETIFQSINPGIQPDAAKVVSRQKLQRPVVSNTYFELWKELGRFNSRPEAKILLTGSYAYPGIPLLETGVLASLDIAEKIVGQQTRVTAG